jgi:hypothetical protein
VLCGDLVAYLRWSLIGVLIVFLQTLSPNWVDPEEFELPLDLPIDGKPAWRNNSEEAQLHMGTEDNEPCALRLEVYDADQLSRDDLIGSYIFDEEMLTYALERTAQTGFCEVILDEKGAKTVKKRKHGDSGAVLRIKLNLMSDDLVLLSPSNQAMAAGSSRSELFVKEKSEQEYELLEAILGRHVYVSQQEENGYLQSQNSEEANFIAARSFSQNQQQMGPWKLQIYKNMLRQLRNMTQRLSREDFISVLGTHGAPELQREQRMPQLLKAFGFDIDRLKLRIIAGANLLAGDYSLKGNHTSDPYVKVTWGRCGRNTRLTSEELRRDPWKNGGYSMQVGRTSTIKTTLDPEWREPEEFELPLDKALKSSAHAKKWEETRGEEYMLKLDVYDYDLARTNDLLGSCTLTQDMIVKALLTTAEHGYFTLPLDETGARSVTSSRGTTRDAVHAGTLSLSLSLLDRKHALFESPSARAKSSGSKRDAHLVHTPTEEDQQELYRAQTHYENIAASGSRGLNRGGTQSYRLAAGVHTGDSAPSYDARDQMGKRLSFRQSGTTSQGMGVVRDTISANTSRPALSLR